MCWGWRVMLTSSLRSPVRHANSTVNQNPVAATTARDKLA